jgi:hypothetical protein
MCSEMTRSEERQKSKFDVMSIKAGDVIFVLPESSGFGKAVQLINIQGQHLLAKVRRRNRLPLKARVRKYSHVMLGAGNGLIIHADGKKVALEVVNDVLNFESTRYEVFRRADLPDAAAVQVAKAGMRYMQQKYSFIKYFGKPRENDTTQFCSRLVAYAYRTVGMPLSDLPDKDVLPLDLYLLCQAAPWSDITADTVLHPVSSETEHMLGEIDIPGVGKRSMSEFFDGSDKLLRKSSQLQKEFEELRYKNFRDILQTEGVLAQYCLAMFVLAKQIRLAPDSIDDEFAGKIVSVLSQIDTLLDLAHLPDVDLLNENTLVNKGGDAGEYAGMPAPVAIREMQNSRETVRIYTYLLMAETGLLSILAHLSQSDKFEAFRGVKSEYVSRFLIALPLIETLPEDVDAENLFAWVGNESDRIFCQKSYKSMIAMLKIIKIATGAQVP